MILPKLYEGDGFIIEEGKLKAVIPHRIFKLESNIMNYSKLRLIQHSCFVDPEIWVSIDKVNSRKVFAIRFVEKSSGLIKIQDILLEMEENLGNPKYLVELALIQEYGYIIPKLKDKNYRIIEVPTNTILFNNEKRMSQKHIEYYKDYNLPVGLVFKNDDKYRLIDGRHRLTAAKE